MNLFRMFIRQLKANTRIITFLFTSYIISIFLISVWTSNYIELKSMALDGTKGLSTNGAKINMVFKESIGFTQFINILNKIEKDTNINFSITSSLGNKNKKYSLELEYFKSKPKWRPNILEGRDYTIDEITKGENKVLVGKKLEPYIYIRDKRKFIEIQKEEFEVMGIIGKKDKKDFWDEGIFMPITSIPESMKINYDGEKNISFYINNSNKKPVEDIKNIEEIVKSFNGKMKVKELKESNNIILQKFGDNNKMLSLAILIYLISIVNILNMCSFWIDDRKFEIGIRKAFGISDFNISMMLILEILSITLVAAFISIILQMILNLFSNEIMGLSINITINNLIIAFIVSAISAFICALIPIFKIIKMEPIESIRR